MQRIYVGQLQACHVSRFMPFSVSCFKQNLAFKLGRNIAIAASTLRRARATMMRFIYLFFNIYKQEQEDTKPSDCHSIGFSLMFGIHRAPCCLPRLMFTWLRGQTAWELLWFSCKRLKARRVLLRDMVHVLLSARSTHIWQCVSHWLKSRVINAKQKK